MKNYVINHMLVFVSNAFKNDYRDKISINKPRSPRRLQPKKREYAESKNKKVFKL